MRVSVDELGLRSWRGGWGGVSWASWDLDGLLVRSSWVVGLGLRSWRGVDLGSCSLWWSCGWGWWGWDVVGELVSGVFVVVGLDLRSWRAGSCGVSLASWEGVDEVVVCPSCVVELELLCWRSSYGGVSCVSVDVVDGFGAWVMSPRMSLRLVFFLMVLCRRRLVHSSSFFFSW